MSNNFSTPTLYELTGDIVFCHLKNPSTKYGKAYLLKILIPKNSNEHKKLLAIDKKFRKELVEQVENVSEADLESIITKFFSENTDIKFEKNKDSVAVSFSKKADFKNENLNRRPVLKVREQIVDDNGNPTGETEIVDADPDVYQSGSKVAVKFTLNYSSKTNSIHSNLVAVLYKSSGEAIITKSHLTGILSYPYLDKPSVVYGTKYSCEVLIPKDSKEHKKLLEEVKKYKDKLIESKITKKASVYCIIDGDKEEIESEEYKGNVALRLAKKADHQKEEFLHLNNPPDYYRQVQLKDQDGNFTGKLGLTDCQGKDFVAGNIVKVAYRLWYAPKNNSINANLDEVVYLEEGTPFGGTITPPDGVLDDWS